MLKIKKYQNGTSLIVQTDRKTKYTSFCLFIKVGSQDEQEKEYGVAHFLEHIFFKSTKTKTSSEISKYLEGLGAHINAETGQETTQYYFRCLTENFEKCLKIFSEMFYKGKFDKEEIDKERLVILEEIKRCQDNSSRMAYLNGQMSLYDGLKFGHMTLGTEQIIKNVLIGEIKEFKKRTYTPNKITISVYSDLNFEIVNKMVLKYFKTTSKAVNKKEDDYIFTVNPKQKYVVHKKDDKQVNLYIFIKIDGYFKNKKKYAQILFSEILGSGMSSRLFIELREKLGLAYSTFSGLNLLRNCGALNLYIGTSPEKVKFVVLEMKKILKDLAENGISPEELKKAKNKIKSQAIFALDNKLRIACKNAFNFAFYNKIESAKQKFKRFEKISLDEVNNIAKEIFREEKIVISAVGKGFEVEDLNF